MKRRPGRPSFPDQLTPAEWRVVEWVRHGLTNPAIADRLGVGVDAVKYHVANACGKLGLDGRLALRRWPGVARASACYPQRGESVMEMCLGPLGQVARGVSDIEAAQRWYRDVLGLPLRYAFGKMAFFDCGGVRLLLSQEEGASASILYFSVPAIHGAAHALQARGVVFLNAPHLIHRHADGTEEWMAFFGDNEGRPLALMAQVAPPAGADHG